MSTQTTPAPRLPVFGRSLLAWLEALEARRLMTGSVTSLTLVNADTNQDLMNLTSGTTLNLGQLPTTNLNVRANVSGAVESVRFSLDAASNYRTESSAPYALAGDNAGDYGAWTPSLGNHTLVATPYDRDSAWGTAGPALAVTFSVVNSVPAAQPVVEGQLVAPPQSAVNKAIAYPLVRYNRYIAGGAHTNQPGTSGATEVLALAAYLGNTSADARLLQQMRYTLTGGNDITANGGYPAQHERHVTTMFILARQTPRIWNQLSDVERTKVDLLMKGSLVATAFTTSDNNPYIRSGTQQRALDGDSNLSRTWNANYREGMAGGVLAGIAYFGIQGATNILASYDHAAFTAQVRSYGLSNMYETFNWKNANPSSAAPTGQMIQDAIRSYRYFGQGLDNPMGIFWKLTSYTFSGTVSAGLNGGAGYKGGGRIVSGAEGLPNKGALGMLMEFNTVDANGPRSSASYSYDGWRTNLANQLALIGGGLWNAASADATNSVSRLSIGSTDLWYKLDRGYIDYYKGSARSTYYSTATDKGYEFTRPLWEQVLAAFHGV